MRVVCCRVVSPTTGEEMGGSPWLTVGREYAVLEITAYPGREILFRILGDDAQSGPGVWDSRLFRSVSTGLPATWTAAVDEEGVLTIGPEKWRRDGFWEAYFDRDEQAVQDFEDALEDGIKR
jgi:hypothetical protein